MSFEDSQDGKRVLAVLGKRLARYGLTLHEGKTRYVGFRDKRPNGQQPETCATSFNFLGFTHVWGKSRRGKNVVRQITAKDRYARSLRTVWEWCKQHRHLPLTIQHGHLVRVMRGHYAYYGLTGNSKRLKWYHHQVKRIWKRWLSCRDRKGTVTWERMQEILKRHPLPVVRIVHRYTRP